MGTRTCGVMLTYSSARQALAWLVDAVPVSRSVLRYADRILGSRPSSLVSRSAVVDPVVTLSNQSGSMTMRPYYLH